LNRRRVELEPKNCGNRERHRNETNYEKHGRLARLRGDPELARVVADRKSTTRLAAFHDEAGRFLPTTDQGRPKRRSGWDHPERQERSGWRRVATVPSGLPMGWALVPRLSEPPSSSFSFSSSEARLAAVPRAAGRRHLTPLSPKRPPRSLRRGPQEEIAFDAKSLRVRSVCSW
jgi:hypothetical protein